MTLARTALRLCAAATLKGETIARPTIAGERVYDSRVSDFAPESSLGDAKPSVIVMTDGDEGDALSKQNGGPPFIRMIDLIIEMGMVQTVKDGPDYIVGYPDTDARHEASLDLLEFQIIRRLAYDPAPMSVLFRKFTRIRKHDCHRQVMDDSGVKIAARILTLTCEVNDDQVQIYNTAGDQPTGLAILPEPLRSVAQALPAGSPGLDICTVMAATLAPVIAPPLERIDFEYDADAAGPTSAIEQVVDLPQP